MPALRVHLVPSLVDPQALTGATVVVIDVLRATTTIATALAAGARDVLVCAEVDDARRAAQGLAIGTAVLGGERRGLRIDGFDLGNSPAEYTPAAIAGKTIVFTTTNGARALLHARGARRILVAGFVNLSAVSAAIREEPQVEILCAGTRGEVGYDDALAAGALADAWLTVNPPPATINDQAVLARDAWRLVSDFPAATEIQPRLVAAIQASQGGRDLTALGMASDIDLAAKIDSIPVLPIFRAETCRATLEGRHQP